MKALVLLTMAMVGSINCLPSQCIPCPRASNLQKRGNFMSCCAAHFDIVDESHRYSRPQPTSKETRFNKHPESSRYLSNELRMKKTTFNEPLKDYEESLKSSDSEDLKRQYRLLAEFEATYRQPKAGENIKHFSSQSVRSDPIKKEVPLWSFEEAPRGAKSLEDVQLRHSEAQTRYRKEKPTLSAQEISFNEFLESSHDSSEELKSRKTSLTEPLREDENSLYTPDPQELERRYQQLAEFEEMYRSTG